MNQIIVDPKPLEDRVIEGINSILLPRKSPQVNSNVIHDTGYYVPQILTPNVQGIKELIKGNVGLNNSSKQKKLWDDWWLYESALALQASGKYHELLPGRSLKYEKLAEVISGLFNGEISNKKIIELGGGSGICQSILAEKGSEVHGLDISKVALFLAKKICDQYGTEVKHHQGDFYKTDFEDEEFDATYNSGVFGHLPKKNAIKLLREMTRITKPGGYIVITVPNTKSKLYQSERKNLNFLFSTFPELRKMPWDTRRVDHGDFSELFDYFSLERIPVEGNGYAGGLQIAPSSIIQKGIFKRKELDFFDRHLPDEARNTVMGRIDAWRVIESKADPDLKRKYGWSHYFIAQKPKK